MKNSGMHSRMMKDEKLEKDEDKWCITNLKPTIHSIRKHGKWGMKPFFRRINYCSRKQGERATIHHSLFAVNFRTNIFATGNFFYEKLLCVRRRDRQLDANPANAYGKKSVCETWRTSTIPTLFAARHFFFILPLYRRLRIV